MAAPPARTVILGAGPAGLAAAWTLAAEGQPTHTLEASDAVGGLARSWVFEGHTVDLGPHRFFTKTRVVNRLWEDALGPELVQVDRLTRIYYRQKFFYYPLKPWNAFFGMGPLRSAAALGSYAWAKAFPEADETTFEGWVRNRFGRVLYETFFKSYTEKLWGLPCHEIGADWAAQRIKGLSLAGAVKNALFGGDGSVKTLVDRFGYPRRGTGQVYERIAARVRERGGTIELGRRAVRIVHDGRGRVTAVETRGRDDTAALLPVDHLVSSMPLSLLVEGFDPPAPDGVVAAARRLLFRNTILVYLLVEGTDLFPDNWIYVHAPEVRMGRITNFRNWSPALMPEGSTRTPLCVELWCFDDDPLWTAPDADLIAQGTRELATMGLVDPARVGPGAVIRLKRCYPVYKKGYQADLAPVVDWLRGFSNLQPIGRYGAFKYNNQDHSILMGILAARNRLGERHDLWALNTDSEYQEELRLAPDPEG